MKKALIIISAEKPNAETLSGEIQSFLKDNNIDFSVYRYTGLPFSAELQDDYDFAVSLGGDGAVLFAARYCAPKNIPVFPVNLGRFGFIADIEPKVWKRELMRFLNEKKAFTNGFCFRQK